MNRRNRRLRRLIEHAHDRVPYYRRLMDDAGVRPRDIRTAADLRVLPLTAKKDLIPLPPDQTLARGVDIEGLLATYTTGSSGEPFITRRSRREQQQWVLEWFRGMRRAGLKATDRTVSIMNSHSAVEQRNPVRRLVAALGMFRTLRLHCGEDLEAMAAAVTSFRPTVLFGMTGTLWRLAELALDQGIDSIRPRLIVLVGEAVTPAMRKTLRTAFGGRLHDSYSCNEFGLMASECPDTGLFHVHERNRIIEVVKDNGQPAGPGETGELVGTSLTAFTSPYIRYCLGDQVTLGPAACPCGHRVRTLERIDGRVIDHFRFPDGRLIHPWDITAPVLRSSSWLRCYQLIQEREDLITLLVVRDDGAGAEAACDRMVAQMRDTVGPTVDLRLRRVQDIPVGPGGKTRTIISRVTNPGS